MNGEDTRQNERQSLLTRLLDAVKQCQVRFGGRSELATDSDSRVSCLCATFEAALQHGMKKNNKALSALRHMTERAGLGKMSDFFSEVKHMDTEPAFWQYVKEHLTKHEVQRFNTLKLITTDMGRGRAWLRACLNEHSLERYMHMLIEKEDIVRHYYHDWAFMCDQERNSMLPTMSAGLGSILFAITIDRPELNKGYQNTVHVGNGGEVIIAGTTDDEPRAIIAGDASPVVKKKEKKKKKKMANVVSFDDDDSSETKSCRHSSVTSASSSNTTDDKSSSTASHHTDTATESPVFERREGPDVAELLQRRSHGSDSSGDRVRSVLQAQSSVTSATSVFSATSADFVSTISKSSTGSLASFDGDIANSILTPVGRTGLHNDSVPQSQASSYTADHLYSDASSEMSVFSRGDVDSAVFGLAVAQKGLESARTEGDGGISEVMSEHSHQYMSHEELRQAVVAMMVRKDEVEEQNRSLQSLLEQEMDMSSMLRADIADLKHSHDKQQEQDQAVISKLQRENELLKHQLKKYVNAVQLLRTEGATNKDDGLGIKLDDVQPSMPPPTQAIDYSHEASEYEQKLIQVAEMHGELMEFNEMLHRQMNAKDAVMRKLREELVMLRGPLPYNEHQMEQSATAAMESLSIQGRTLINIWIPSAFLRGPSSDQFHVYQVYVRIKDEEWNVFRRYSQFLDLHTRLKKVYPIVSKFDFPPKKSMGSKDTKVVEARRLGFQFYLRNVINTLQEKNPELCSDTCKARLVALLPFFGDQPEAAGKKGKKKQQKLPAQQQQPPPPQSQQQQATLPAASAPQGGATGGALYQGL
ncbi:sorting nexin-29-like [Littorina saxatilis]|uniref:Sorting nexin-29 n=1 Tax=Littorina saxatilis TaxID=31220 RepID=A0AAN9C2X2_9CAEN